MINKIKKFIIVLSLFFLSIFSSLSAMQFGQMGSKSFGMAGTGVAVNSSYSMYYNPALMATGSFISAGLSLDLRGLSNNFLELLSYEFDKLEATDLDKIKSLVKDSYFYTSTRNGLYFTVSSHLGAFGIGAELSGFGSAVTSIKIPSNKDTIKNPNQTVDAKMYFNSYTMLEVPVGYAYEFHTVMGDISIGSSVSLIALSQSNGSFGLDSLTNSMSNVLNIGLDNFKYNWSTNVGILYEPVDWFNIGVVGKYLNSPEFKFVNETVKIDPQARFGAALDFGIFTLATDVDLTKNKWITREFYNQMVSVGTEFDLKFIQLRGGVAFDLLHKDDMIFSAGLGFSFIDIGVQFGKKTVPFDKYKIPSYFALNVGAGFSF